MVGIKVLIDHVLFVGNRSKRRYEFILPNKFAFVVIAVDSHEVSYSFMLRYKLTNYKFICYVIVVCYVEPLGNRHKRGKKYISFDVDCK